MSTLALGCSMQALSHYSKQGLLFVGAQSSHCGGFSCCKAQALSTWAQ